jgi:hypothetical protein
MKQIKLFQGLKSATVLEIDYSHGYVWAETDSGNQLSLIWSGCFLADIGDRILFCPLTMEVASESLSDFFNPVNPKIIKLK